MEKSILKLIEKSKIEFNRDAQRAELLSRNGNFLKELELVLKEIEGDNFFKIMKIPKKKLEKTTLDNILVKLDYPTDSKKYLKGEEHFELICKMQDWGRGIKFSFDEHTSKRPKKLILVVMNKLLTLGKYIRKWKDFCERWNIRSEWDSKLSSLKDNLNPPILLYGQKGDNKRAPFFLIKIDNWTTQKDIIDAWGYIEAIQKKIWKKQVLRTYFMRDLCWYDLNKKYGMKPRQIAEIWIKSFPDEIDILVIRRIKKTNKELKEEDELGLLEEIKTDPHLIDLKEQFDDERKWYITGQSERGKFNAPFIDVTWKIHKKSCFPR